MLLTVLVFIFILGILVLVHELGHFLAAKKLGIKVEEFGFGLPPKIFGKKIGETVYSFNLLPIGGFVKLYGEDDLESAGPVSPFPPAGAPRLNRRGPRQREPFQASHPPTLERAFFTKKPWQRALVLLAGVVMNFLLGWGIISFLLTQGVMVPTERVRVEKVLPETPAAEAGLREGDIINKLKVKSEKLKIEDDITKERKNEIGEEFTVYEIKSPKDLVEATKKYLGEEVILIIQREKEWVNQYPIGGQITHSFETLPSESEGLEVKITPRKDYPKDQGPMGVVITNFEERVYPWYQAPFLGFTESFRMSWRLLAGVGQTLWKIVTFQSVGRDVAGPLGIAQLTGEAVKFGKLAVLEFLGLLSINLAVINILPFPALDGGRLLFVGIEGVTGRKLRPRWEKHVHQIGMAILLGLILLVTVNDLLRIFSR